MDLKTQAAKAEKFRQLHDKSRLLVLPNAWDVASALVLELAGFPAIATTSAGVAWALGYPDGERITRETMLEAVRRIAQRVSVPVTADMLAGFGPTPEDAAETVRGVIAAGAVGLNMEDRSNDPRDPLVEVALNAEKIRAARAAATDAGVAVVINARTDVFLLSVGGPETRLEHAVRRANAYREAGADCLFVPGVENSTTIVQLARLISGPINILARAGTPPLPEPPGWAWRA
jgi:2-methylisocitrate lyase-like PEP mutase family enzyme